MTIEEARSNEYMWGELKKILFFDTEFVGIKKNFGHLPKAAQQAIIHKWESMPDYQEFIKKKTNTPAKYWQTHAGLTDFKKLVCTSVGFINSEDEFETRSLVLDDKTTPKDNLNKIANTFSWTRFKSICAHYVQADLRAIAQECIQHQKPLPSRIMVALNVKPWDFNKKNGTTFCTNMLANTFYGRFTRLTDLCAILGVDTPKDDIDGSEVHKLYYKGEIDRIATYCEKDVRATFKCFIKLFSYING